MNRDAWKVVEERRGCFQDDDNNGATSWITLLKDSLLALKLIMKFNTSCEVFILF